MARAGFFYTPNDDSEDMVHCPYCQIGLDGWEPKDDPWYIYSTQVTLTIQGRAQAKDTRLPILRRFRWFRPTFRRILTCHSSHCTYPRYKKTRRRNRDCHAKEATEEQAKINPTKC